MAVFRGFQYSLSLLLLITALVYSPALFNDFSGDDAGILLNNTFYYEQRDISSFFSKGYTTDPLKAASGALENKGSGSVAFRPVLSLSYMLDAFLWGRNPFGFHLSNLFIHCVCVGLIYILSLELFSLPVAFWGALLFGVHPLNGEAVLAIGYRADLLAGMFVLLSVLFWGKFLRQGGWPLAGSGLCYGAALFSKESAVLAPIIFLGFQQYADGSRSAVKGACPYILFLGILGIYLVSYFYIFPNPAIT
ncbi:MAG: glycosyltransferase family 39 protein, partial [Candidatus Omnitrophica bacterium]|nr:glycosyltransferase family 39 protein [Candidatus Omnitrophota bacterium]